jgi:Ca2+-binding EF-hand superfamily protein
MVDNSYSSKLSQKPERKGFADDIELKKLELEPNIRQAIIREAFKMFDTDGSCEIDAKEFKKLVKSLGLEMNNKRIKDLMKRIDINGSGTIDMEEFTAMMLSYQFNKESPVEAHLENAFNLYDKDQNGIISQDDLLKVSQELEDILTMEEANLLISFAKNLGKELKQNEKSSGITKEEFYNLLVKLGFLVEMKEDPNNPQGGANNNDKNSHKGDTNAVSFNSKIH